MKLYEIKQPTVIDLLSQYKDWSVDEITKHIKTTLPDEIKRLTARYEYFYNRQQDIEQNVESRMKAKNPHVELTWEDIQKAFTPAEKKEYYKMEKEAEDTIDQITKLEGLLNNLRSLRTARKHKPVTIPQLPNIPQKIPLMPGRIVRNPYYEGTKGRYAGDPATYPFTLSQKKLYDNLVAILGRNGHRLTHMYAGVLTHGVHTFVVYAGNSQFAWYKYGAESDPAAGQNWVFFGGVRMTTSHFMELSSEEQDKWVALI